MGDDFNRKILAVIIWTLWFSRNQLLHEGIRQSFQEISCFVTGYLKELDSLPYENTHLSVQR